MSWAVYLQRVVPPDASSPEMIAAREILDDLSGRLPEQADILLIPRGGTTAYLVGGAISAHLDTPNRTVVLLSDGRSASSATTGLVLTIGAADTSRAGPVLARYEPPSRGDGPAAAAEEVRAHAAANQPLEIEPIVSSFFSTYIDGAAARVCAEDLSAHPDRLLDLPPEVVTSLYVELSVIRPTLTVELQSAAEEWSATVPVTLRQLSGEQLRNAISRLDVDPDPLVISEHSC